MYSVFIERSVFKQLRSIPEKDFHKVMDVISHLTENPYPIGCQKLTNREGFRIRVGDYRILYRVHDLHLIVTVVAAGHRKDIYR